MKQTINNTVICGLSTLIFASCSINQESHEIRTNTDSHSVPIENAISELNTTLRLLYSDTKTPTAKSTSNISEIITVTYEDLMGLKTKSDENSDFENLLYVGTDDIATVIKRIADGIGVTYNYLGSGGTFAAPKKVARYLKSIGYSSAKVHTQYIESEIIMMLTHKKPVFIGALGSRVNTDEKKGSGHAWVIDGIKIKWDGSGRKHLLHCNWGWNGDCNGYYISKIFNTANGAVEYDEEDDGTHSMNTKYTWWYRILTY